MEQPRLPPVLLLCLLSLNPLPLIAAVLLLLFHQSPAPGSKTSPPLSLEVPETSSPAPTVDRSTATGSATPSPTTSLERRPPSGSSPTTEPPTFQGRTLVPGIPLPLARPTSIGKQAPARGQKQTLTPTAPDSTSLPPLGLLSASLVSAKPRCPGISSASSGKRRHHRRR